MLDLLPREPTMKGTVALVIPCRLTLTPRSEHDQELDSLLVGPIPVGVNKFIFEADSPDLKRIPTSEILGVTVILLSCSYDDREFVRVGYYVNNEYDNEEMNDDPPAKPVIEKVRRNILAEKPRVTRFAIKWSGPGNVVAISRGNADNSSGTLKIPHLQSSLRSSPKQTLLKTMARPTALKKQSSKQQKPKQRSPKA